MRLVSDTADDNASPSSSLDHTARSGPSSIGLDSHPSAGPSASNGHHVHTNGNGFMPTSPTATNNTTNGSSAHPVSENGASPKSQGKAVARVNLPGHRLYADSNIDREEYVRLVLQSLRDVGYNEAAATLEAESGYSMESPEVSHFRRCILDGSWMKAIAALQELSVGPNGDPWEAQFLINRQKYLELLEARRTTEALQVLRNDLAPLAASEVDSDQIHSLSSLIMCTDPEEVRQRAGWDGASGSSRQHLLSSLQRHIPPEVMIPQRRLENLLNQSHTSQQQRCLYHTAPLNEFSLFTDHQCDLSSFPRTNTTILHLHTDEVWFIAWSHNGHLLASASKDRSVVIWRMEPDSDAGVRDWSAQHVLRDHENPVNCLAWSLDDSILLTGSENSIKIWNTRTGLCIRVLDNHSEPVSGFAWLPDNSGFISAGLDRQIHCWSSSGVERDAWNATIRVTDLAITPNGSKLVVIGLEPVHQPDSNSPRGGSNNNVSPPPSQKMIFRMVVFDLATREIESDVPFDGELTSVKISQDSQYALFNHAPDEIRLWDIPQGRLARKFNGQKQGTNIIRSCFGGTTDNFVVSGSEDSNVYIWHRDTEVLLEILSGHGPGSVNSVAWNPRNERMFASCSDDHSIRIWETTPVVQSAASPAPSEYASTRPLNAEADGKAKNKARRRVDADGVSNSNSGAASSHSSSAIIAAGV